MANNSEVMKWLNSRNHKSAKDVYLFSKHDLIKHEEIENVFHKFDMDNSGSIEIGELYLMFQSNGIDIDKEELRKLFYMVDKSKTGSLDINEFKKFSDNEEANGLFRKWIKQMRKQRDMHRKSIEKSYIPFNLNRLLDHLSVAAKRENLVTKIEKNKFNHSSTQQNIKDFIKLFILDESSKESIIKEETAKRIETAI